MAKKRSAIQSAKQQAESGDVVVLKVALRYQANIWRRIAIRASQTLEELHFAIYDAFDHDEEHLYSFYLPAPGYLSRKAMREAPEFAHPMIAEEADPWSQREVYSAGDVTLAELQLRARQKLLYLFDFGDSWWHVITVEKLNAPGTAGTYPRVIESNGKSPPQYPTDDEEDEVELAKGMLIHEGSAIQQSLNRLPQPFAGFLHRPVIRHRRIRRLPLPLQRPLAGFPPC
jgi:hypothetical protein